MSDNSWMQDASIRDIEPKKLDFLQKLVFESEKLTSKERLPFFLAIANRSKQENINFTEEEVSRIITVLKKVSTPKEIAKMDQILRLFKEKKT